MSKSDPLKPTATVLCKLGSAVVHAEEYFGPRGNPVDKMAFDSLTADSEVQDWMKAMKSFLPVKR